MHLGVLADWSSVAWQTGAVAVWSRRPVAWISSSDVGSSMLLVICSVFKPIRSGQYLPSPHCKEYGSPP